MIRTQISLDDQQMAALRELARRREVSIAAVVREAVDDALRDDLQRRRIRRALDAVSSPAQGTGHTDIARHHDEYLAEAFDA